VSCHNTDLTTIDTGLLSRYWREASRPPGIDQSDNLVARVWRFFKAIIWGSKTSAKTKAARIDRHLSVKYRAGNANFRIQKVKEGVNNGGGF